MSQVQSIFQHFSTLSLLKSKVLEPLEIHDHLSLVALERVPISGLGECPVSVPAVFEGRASQIGSGFAASERVNAGLRGRRFQTSA